MPIRTRSAVIALIVSAGILTTACGHNDGNSQADPPNSQTPVSAEQTSEPADTGGPAPSPVATELSSPETSANPGQEYSSVEALQQAAVAAGMRCSSTSQTTFPQGVQIDCTADSVMVLANSPADLQQALGNETGPLDDTSLDLVGPNWLISSSKAETTMLATKLGGELRPRHEVR